MSFRVEDHDVTCLCALVDLPRAVIVEELPAVDGRARFQLQAFTQGAVGELLRWMEPPLAGASVRRWEQAFAMARVEVADREDAAFVRQGLRAMAENSCAEFRVAATVAEETSSVPQRAERLARAMAGL